MSRHYYPAGRSPSCPRTRITSRPPTPPGRDDDQQHFRGRGHTAPTHNTKKNITEKIPTGRLQASRCLTKREKITSINRLCSLAAPTSPFPPSRASCPKALVPALSRAPVTRFVAHLVAKPDRRTKSPHLREPFAYAFHSADIPTITVVSSFPPSKMLVCVCVQQCKGFRIVAYVWKRQRKALENERSWRGVLCL